MQSRRLHGGSGTLPPSDRRALDPLFPALANCNHHARNGADGEQFEDAWLREGRGNACCGWKRYEA